MKNMKFWRTALVATLVLTVMLSVTGGTIAWFTDEVTSANNIVKSGNLEVAMSWSDTQNGTYKDASEGAIFNYQLWEPGYTDVKYIKIENKGNLAFKYQLNIKPTVQVAAGEVNLADVIEVYFGTGDAPTSTAELHAATMAGTVSELALDTDGAAYGVLLPAGATEKNDFEEVGSVTRWIALHMKEEAGNDYQNKSVGEGFALTLLATQYTYENDSFGNQYDKDATYDNSIWNGAPGNPEDVPEADVDNVITISTASELAAFAAAVNEGTSYSGTTVKLAADIDLNNQPWTPIGSVDTPAYFQGTFDGQGHTISGLNVDKSTDSNKNASAGFFGWIDAAAATIKNVNFDGANVKGSHWVGVVAGYMTGEISNCHVTNSTVTGYNVNDDANGDKIGGIVGFMNDGNGKLESNSVKNSTISGNRDVGGLAGAANETNTVKNNRVEDVNVIYTSGNVDEIISPRLPVEVDATNTAVNVKILQCIADGLYKDTAGNMTVTNANGLISLNNFFASNTITNSVWGKTYTIGADIDAIGLTWNNVYMTTGSAEADGIIIDGQGHTISNLTINGGGLLGGTPNGSVEGVEPGVVRDLTFDNVTVTGDHFTSVVWGGAAICGDVNFENVHVINSNITGKCNVGAFIGGTGEQTATHDLTISFENCSVKNTKITAEGKDGQDPTGANAFVGRAYANTYLTFEGTNVSEGNTITNNNGLVGGGIYGYTIWDSSVEGNWRDTGSCDTFTNWDGIQ